MFNYKTYKPIRLSAPFSSTYMKIIIKLKKMQFQKVEITI